MTLVKLPERNPTLLKPLDNRNPPHGLGRWERRITPLPSVSFYCFDCCAVGFNRFVYRPFQTRWVTLHYKLPSSNLHTRILCVKQRFFLFCIMLSKYNITFLPYFGVHGACCNTAIQSHEETIILEILFRIMVVVIGINLLAVLFYRGFLPLGIYLAGPDLTEKQ